MSNILTPLVVAKVGTKNQNATYRYLTHIYTSDYADEYFFQLLNDDYERRELRKDIRILKTLVRKIERVMNLDPDIWVADKSIYTFILQDYIVKFSALLGHAEYFLTAIQEPENDLIQGS